MPSLKDLRNRIASVKATQKITKAMQMVAAAKLRRAQSAAEAARPFSERMEKVLANVAGNIDQEQGGPEQGRPSLLVGTGSDNTHLLVVCTGERGLAGAFNTAIVRLARERANKLLAEGKTVKIFTVGKKGNDQLRRQFDKYIVEKTDLRGVRAPGFEQAEGIAKKILELFDKGEFDVCTLFYSRFQSVISQVPTAQQLIPLEIPKKEEKDKKAEEQVFYDYEPDEDEILSSLLPRNIAIQILKALLENNASFFGAQMSAMDSATRNAGDMIKAQTLQYNRTRQAMITKELIEIISGAEAL